MLGESRARWGAIQSVNRGIAAAMTVKGIYDFVIRVGGGRWAEIT